MWFQQRGVIEGRTQHVYIQCATVTGMFIIYTLHLLRVGGFAWKAILSILKTKNQGTLMLDLSNNNNNNNNHINVYAMMKWSHENIILTGQSALDGWCGTILCHIPSLSQVLSLEPTLTWIDLEARVNFIFLLFRYHTKLKQCAWSTSPGQQSRVPASTLPWIPYGQLW